MTHSIARALDTVRRSIPPGVELVAVSKFHPAEAVTKHMPQDSVSSAKAAFRSSSQKKGRRSPPPTSVGTSSATYRPTKSDSS